MESHCGAPGDIADNLRCLHDSRDTITDDTTQKLINLLDAGWPTEKLVGAIDFVNDVEQGHGSGAALMLQHNMYSERTLRCRSVIHQTSVGPWSTPRRPTSR